MKPNRRRILAVGTVLGLLLSVALVFLRKALHHKINDPEKLEKATGIPVYATIDT